MRSNQSETEQRVSDLNHDESKSFASYAGKAGRGLDLFAGVVLIGAIVYYIIKIL